MSVQRGAEAVARIAALPVSEALVIGALRARCEGPDQMALFASELRQMAGAERGLRLEESLDDFFALLLRHLRRPLMRHGMTCGCVGADEAVLAHLVSIAASGDREDAMLMACLLVRADVAPSVVHRACLLGLELMRAAPAPITTLPDRPGGATLH